MPSSWTCSRRAAVGSGAPALREYECRLFDFQLIGRGPRSSGGGFGAAGGGAEGATEPVVRTAAAAGEARTPRSAHAATILPGGRRAGGGQPYCKQSDKLSQAKQAWLHGRARAPKRRRDETPAMPEGAGAAGVAGGSNGLQAFVGRWRAAADACERRAMAAGRGRRGPQQRWTEAAAELAAAECRRVGGEAESGGSPWPGGVDLRWVERGILVWRRNPEARRDFDLPVLR